jgi:uncharacterized sporulation protein YeaH/YhbH (DUF444 family)
MSQFIDRRLNSKNKSMVNRQRFIRRFKNQIKQAVSEAINSRSITNIEQGEKITIPAKDLQEPTFKQGVGGIYEQVFPGNKEFIKGDKIKRPDGKNISHGSSEASDKGDGHDNFIFEISREEFLELFFDDLELPNLVRKQLHNIDTQKPIRAGYTSHGVPTNINILRSMRRAIGRKISLTGAHINKIAKIEQELADLEKKSNNNSEDNLTKILDLKQQITKIKSRINNIPYIDSIDIKYHNKIMQPSPSTGAVMFCIMDVSGSMDEAKKRHSEKIFHFIIFIFDSHLCSKKIINSTLTKSF